mmetsp:Transcript_10221/g.46890  ORF Transcript_10221/g.46890 Transcript_10221/m.46890 type:complete len:402 (+) Transcript_10221:3891-5096(+)
MGRGRGVNRERARVADVGHVADELERVDEGGTRLARVCGLDAEDDHAATLALDVLDVLGVLGIVLEAGVSDPGNLGVGLEVLGDLEGVLAVAVHAKRQGLDTLEKHPRVVGGLGSSDVAKPDGEHAELVREGREGLGEVVAPSETAVGGVRFVEEGMPAGGPVEPALLDAHAADAGAVAADPLGEGGDDDVRAEVEAPGQVRGGEGAVHDEGHVVVVGNLGDGLKVADLERGVGHGLAEDGAGLVVNRCPDVLGVVHVDEPDGDAEGGEDVVELRVGATVQLVAGHDVVASLGEVDDGVENGGSSGGGGDRSEGVATLELGHARLEDVGGGVADTGVDVAELLQGEQVGGVLGVLELVRGSAVEGNAAGGTLTETIDVLITDGVVATVKGDGIESLRHVLV